MKLLCFDVGTKRIGVAVGDTDAGFAFPKTVLANTHDLTDQIRQLVIAHNPDTFVVGESSSGTSKENEISKTITQFVRFLKRDFELPVVMQNEHGTSQSVRRMHQSMQGERFDTARKVAQSRDPIDASAAALILQRYLETHH